MKTELKVYVSEKWRFYLSVCVWVRVSVCICAQPDVKYVWTTLLCKMPNILQLVDVARPGSHSLSPFRSFICSPPFFPSFFFLLLYMCVCWRMCGSAGVCEWVDCCARKSHLNYNDDATHTPTHTHTRCHTRGREKSEIYGRVSAFAFRYSNGKYP